MRTIHVDTENRTEGHNHLEINPMIADVITEGVGMLKAMLMNSEMLRRAEDEQWAEMLSWRKQEPRARATFWKGSRWEWAKMMVGKIHL